MQRQIKGMLYLFIMEGRRTLSIFWGIMLSTLLLSLILVSIFIKDPNGDIYITFIISVAVYVYCAIYGFNTVKEDFSFTIKLGAMRRNIWLSKIIYFLGLSALLAILITVVQKVFAILANIFGVSSQTFQLIHPADILDGSLLQQLVIDFSVSFFTLAIFYLFGIMFYKYGLVGGGGLVSTLVVATIFILQTDWISSLNISFTLTLFSVVFLVGLMLYLVTWPFIRKITIL